MKKIVHKSAAPLYAAAVVWVLYALVFPLYRIIHFAIVAVASAVVYLIAKSLCKDISHNGYFLLCGISIH